MSRNLIVLPFLLIISYCSFSQGFGIGTINPDTSAVLDITHNAKGMLIPRMRTNEIFSIVSPARGLIVYDSVISQLMVNKGTSTSPDWQPLVYANAVWALAGNNGINPNNQFIGTLDAQPLRFRVNNIRVGELHQGNGNVFWGLRAGLNTTAGNNNVAIGTDALKSNTGTSRLVAIGDSAMFNNSTGDANTAVGYQSLLNNSTGPNNTATGFQSLLFNTTGHNNTATGFQALVNNTGGFQNTAVGAGALKSNTTGSINTAVGMNALFSNTTGFTNTATGFAALFSNTSGNFNSAHGEFSLNLNTTGEANTANGNFSLQLNTIGRSNTASGHKALFNNTTGSFNTSIGSFAGDLLTSDNTSTMIGAQANNNTGIPLNNSTALGFNATVTASNQVRFGNGATTSIGGIVAYTNLSDGRYKLNVQESVKGIDFIMKLKPVTYQLDIASINSKLHPNKRPDEQFNSSMEENSSTIFSGFVAQDVEQAAKEAGYNFSGVDKPKNEYDFYGLRYSEFVVPIVKALQEQQQMIIDLKKINTDQKNLINDLLKRLENLEASAVRK